MKKKNNFYKNHIIEILKADFGTSQQPLIRKD